MEIGDERVTSFRLERRTPVLIFAVLPADLAAIPDFQSGAMENWGLTTYRETGLLYDPERSSPSDKLAITKVIAHELAHQVSPPPGVFVSGLLEGSWNAVEDSCPVPVSSGSETW